MPWAVAAGYEDRSPSDWWDARFAFRADHPLSFYMTKWFALAGLGLACWVGLVGLALGVTSARFRERHVGTATPGQLGAIRAFVCLLLAWFAWHQSAGQALTMSIDARHTAGVMDWAYPAGFDAVATSRARVELLRAGTVTALLLAAVGLATRPMLVLGGVGYLLLGGIKRSYLNFSHAGLLPLYLLAALAVTRSGDGFSLGVLWRIWRGRPVQPAGVARPHYAWARWSVFLVISLWYCCAGLSKLRNGGFLWWDGLNMKYLILADALRPNEAARRWTIGLAAWPTWLFGVLGLGTLFLETCYPLVLVSRFFRRIIPIGVAGMHLGIGVVMRIWFWDLVWLQAIFYDWSVPLRWLGARLPGVTPAAGGWSVRGREIVRRVDVAGVVRWQGAAEAVPEAGPPRVAWPWLAPAAAVVLVVGQMGVWLTGTEWYPLTGVQMFSHADRTGTVHHYRAMATFADGRREIVYLQDMNLGTGFYTDLLADPFRTSELHARTAAELRRCARWHNARIDDPADRIVRMEAVRFEWDFANAPAGVDESPEVDAFAVVID